MHTYQYITVNDIVHADTQLTQSSLLHGPILLLLSLVSAWKGDEIIAVSLSYNGVQVATAQDRQSHAVTRSVYALSTYMAKCVLNVAIMKTRSRREL
jgi:hypothetical protein